MTTSWRRLLALGAADRRLLVETALAILRARLELRLVPFAVLRQRMDEARPSRRAAPQDLDRVAWAVAAVARRLPGMTCLVQSLAALALLRRRGYRPELHIGVRGRGSGAAVPLDAHAWVECDGRVVAGEVDDLAAYGRLQPVGPPATAAPGSS
ncbi:MAG: lasso peptide biosynthesis B2 protein [Gemmatimonadales bacterium]